jgi:hypothetical protein
MGKNGGNTGIANGVIRRNKKTFEINLSEKVI